MSSSNVVFVCDTGRMFHTENKVLVPEWPTFTDVYSFTVSYRTTLIIQLGSWLLGTLLVSFGERPESIE